jgi:hypothetical protein
MQVRSVKTSKATRRVFKIALQSIIPQESTIPFQHAQHYNILMKVQFQGGKSDEGVYSFKIDGHEGKRIQVKGKRTIYKRTHPSKP